MLLDLLREHLGIAHGVESQERLGEAGREGGLRLRDTLLGTSHLGGVAGDEVVHGLLGVELGDRRQHTTGIACQKNNVLGMFRRDAGDLGVLDVLDGVGAAGILGQGIVIIVNESSFWVEDDVLENGAEADSVENVGLLLSRQTNALGIAATLDVEDASVAPAMLIVTDQGTLGVSREGSLTRTRQAEEYRDVSILAFVG